MSKTLKKKISKTQTKQYQTESGRQNKTQENDYKTKTKKSLRLISKTTYKLIFFTEIMKPKQVL